MRIWSNERQKLAYDGGSVHMTVTDEPGRGRRSVGQVIGHPNAGKRWPKGHKVVIAPGLNEITDETSLELLHADPAFHDHIKNGFLVEQPDTPEDFEDDPAPVVQPDPAASIKPGDDVVAKSVADFMNADADTQAAIYPTLSDAEKALVDAKRKEAQ